MFTLCSTKFCPKTSGDTIISEAICSKVLVWLDQVVKSNPKNSKYVNLVLLENSFYICEELSSLANQLKHPTRLNPRSIAGAAAAQSNDGEFGGMNSMLVEEERQILAIGRKVGELIHKALQKAQSVNERALQAYVEESYSYHFDKLIKDEAKLGNARLEEIRTLYERQFPNQ